MTAERHRSMVAADWPEVEAIYRAGIASGQATFEAAPPVSWEAFTRGKHPALQLVATSADGSLLGWAAAGPTSQREVYRGVVEHSIYVHPSAAGAGVGSRLLAAFIDLAEEHGIWTIQASIFRENTASLRLHSRHGFRVVGTRERIGRMNHGPLMGSWRDTVILERRSNKVGL